MAGQRLFWQLARPYILTIIPCIVLIGVLAIGSARKFYTREINSNLHRQAELTRYMLSGVSNLDGEPAVDRLAKELGEVSDMRVTIILPRGRVVGDSHEDVGNMENHAGRPEVIEALSRRAPSFVHRFSVTRQLHMYYCALPVISGDSIVAIVRTSVPSSELNGTLRGMYFQLGIAGLLLSLLVVTVTLLVARRIQHPIILMTSSAGRFAQGDLNARVPVPNSEEFGRLAETMNNMAVQLSERVMTFTRQRNEQEAILASMVEGVLAVDGNDKLIKLNTAAAAFLGLSPEQAIGRSIQETVRNSQLLQLISATTQNEAPVEEEIILSPPGLADRFVQTQGTVLRDAHGKNIGVLVVLNDVTRIRKLESVRREFVANVSHELRTPLTSLKGYVETLLGGKLEDSPSQRKFLEIIARQADRLNAIIEDLLSLSRIEQQTERAEIALREERLCDILKHAVEECKAMADDKHIFIELKCAPELMAQVNASLLHQAIVNLLQNAVKYSPENSRVLVSATEKESMTEVSVIDNGPGIPAEHLERIFERFYRVDRGRSREHGGTGLGLAIVKHIALAHGGSVTVESKVGGGSTFTVHLRRAS